MKIKKYIYPVMFVIIGLLIFAAIFADTRAERTEVSYTEFLEHVEYARVEGVILRDSPRIEFTLLNDYVIYTTNNPRMDGFKEFLLINGIAVSETGGVLENGLVQSGISFAIIGVAFFVVYRLMRKNSPNNSMGMESKEVTAEAKEMIKFANVAGNEEVKESVKDLVSFLKKPEKYVKYGARMPKGIIFYGPPGTGKTLMAQAIAGEAGVSFFAVSGSDFVQMYVGVGASRIREIFKAAREAKRAIIFIDEIDALGKKRSSSALSGNDERDQTLNALLTEMSGFNEKDGIIVIAATNRLDMLDEALLRPGRFDRHVEIGLPDISARKRILTLHSKNKPFANDVCFTSLAKQTVCFSGAMLENLLNEAAIFAANRSSEAIEYIDVDRAYYTILAGAEKKDRSNISDTDRRITAYHEAGHALVAKVEAPENTISKVTIIPSTKGFGGFCVNVPPDRMYSTKKDIETKVKIFLAGRAAEELIFGEDNITTGASGDIEQATSLIRDYVSKYGMSGRIGILNMDMLKEEGAVATECKRVMEELYEQTKKLLEQKADLLKEIAETLLQQESLNEEELDGIVKKY